MMANGSFSARGALWLIALIAAPVPSSCRPIIDAALIDAARTVAASLAKFRHRSEE
jgi:hypothetical protein